MDWIDQMPDEAFKALIIAGPCLAIVAGSLFAILESKPGRRFAHGVLLLASLSFGVGILIAAIRESDKLSHFAIKAVAIGVLLTTISYACYIIGASSKIGVATIVLAVCTVVSAIVMGLSVNTDKCQSVPDTTGSSSYQC